MNFGNDPPPLVMLLDHYRIAVFKTSMAFLFLSFPLKHCGREQSMTGQNRRFLLCSIWLIHGVTICGPVFIEIICWKVERNPKTQQQKARK